MTDEAPMPTHAAIESELPMHGSPAGTTPMQAAEAPASRTALIVAAVALLLTLVGGVVLWRQGAATAGMLAQIQGRLDTLDQRASALEARPAPTPAPDLRPLQQRLAALEQLPQRVTTLEQKPPPVAQLDTAAQQQMAGLSSRIDGVAARQDQLGTREQADIAKVNEQLGSLDTRLTAAAKAGGEITAINERQSRTAQLQAAAGALAAGRPLGPIAGAPPALAQFATVAPPTEAALRLSFDAAATSAQQAGQPPAATTPFLSRMWDRVQSGVVVREGDRVLVGDAVTGVLEHAKRQLQAGDLPGAVAALDGLAGPAAAAMAPWRAQAQSLIDARAALVTAARG